MNVQQARQVQPTNRHEAKSHAEVGEPIRLQGVLDETASIVSAYALDATRGDARAGAIVLAAESARKTATLLSRIPKLVSEGDLVILRGKMRDLRTLVESERLYGMVRSGRG